MGTMRGREEHAVVPAVTVPSVVADPPSHPTRGIDVGEARESPIPSPPWHDHYRHHHHHTNGSDHFRRLEDRMDHLHDQILATQRLVQDLARHFDPERSGQQRSPPRLTVRTLSSKALVTGHRLGSFASSPPGGGPSSSLPIAATLLSAMAPKASSPTTMQAAVELSNGRAHDEAKPIETSDAANDMATRPAAHAEYHVAAQTRKLSATNPVSLLPAKREPKPLVAMAVAHAVTFIAEVVNAKSTKTMPTNTDPHRPPTTVNESGPVRGRRFSISSLNADAPHLHAHRPRRVDRVAKWTRNLFRPSLEAVVAPEEIEHARREYASLHRFSIRHDSAQRMVWDVIVMLMILVDIVITPLSLGFRFFPHGMATYNVVGNLIFATDFAVHLLSSYTTPRGVLVSHPRRTISHYLTSPWALADFLSWFPFEVFVESEQGRFLGVAKVIRLAKVSQLARRLHSARKVGVFRFLRLLIIVFIVSHCLSCYWNWVAVDWRHAEDGYQDMTLGAQYAHCWSLVIGSLNASPPAMHSTTEEVSVAIFMLIGNVLQATVFGSVAVLIQSFDEDEVAYNKKLISTYERCRFLDIPETLARRIQGYYENLYRETRSVDPDADAFINELSPALICEVKFQLYRDMITQIPFLSATHINPVVIEMLILHLRTVIYMQDDVLIRKGEVGDWMGFIGSKGSVGVLDPKSEFRKIIRILRKGDYFGEMALLQRAKRSTTAIALTWVQIHVLCRNDLDDVKDQYPEQAEILEHEITKYMQTKVKYK